jgi:ubiquinone biosynthesis UbiH/UbiF/VisC/COQ6 family hydroxylase
MRIAGDQPGSVMDFSSFEQGVEALAWIVDAAALESVLAHAVQFAPHVSLVDRTVPATLLAVADGRDSKSREALGVRNEMHAYGHSGVAARLVADRPHSGVARQWFRSPDIVAMLPFDRPQLGFSYGLVWSVPEAQAREWVEMDPSNFEDRLMEATQGLAGTLRLSSDRAAWPLRLARAHPVCGAGWVLLGDAAHAVHPLSGQGLNLGLADVECLARVVESREAFRSLGDERLLRRYARERWLPTRAMGELTHGLLHLFSSQDPMVKTLRNRGLNWVNSLSPLKKALTTRALHS